MSLARASLPQRRYNGLEDIRTMASALDRLTYAARQTARVAWYAGHYAAGLRLLKPMPKPEFPIGPTPSRAELTVDMRALFEREWQDIATGLFPAPRARGPEPTEFLRRSLLYFRDLPLVDARRHGQSDELPPGEQGDGLPDYYRQNFHFQSDGWLSEHSAAIYDTQVEVLFTGAAEKLPFDDASLDLVISSFLLHELPKAIREQAVADMKRVVKPDGLVVIVDSIQKGDHPGWDGLLDLFPHYFHEPYYAEYANGRLEAWGEAAGLKVVATERAFLSKVAAFAK